MISIDVPAVSANYYFVYRGVILGPFAADGKYPRSILPYRSKADVLSGNRGVFGENSVFHWQAEGYLSYNPINLHYDRTPTPLDSAYPHYPNKVTARLANSYDVMTTAVGNYGCAAFDTSGYRQSTSTMWEQVAYAMNGDELVMYVLRGNRDTVTEGWKYSLTSIGLTANGRSMSSFQNGWQATGVLPNPVAWGYSPQSAATIVAYAESLVWKLYTTGTITTSVGHVGTDMSLNPSVLKEQIEMAIFRLNLHEYEGEPVDYGELAMEASEKANNNSVNMIAFLRDLRQPLSMVPKLRNLAAIKSHANNYLAVKYGILPTIDDLKSILEAFKKVGPFLDKNGYQVLTAARTEEQQQNDVSLVFQRRLKLAVDDEDNEFEALIERIESMGMLPTLKNVWDLIPYSFVLDWFADVGDFLARVDANLRLSRQNIRYVTMSESTDRSIDLVPSVVCHLSGKLTTRTYHRWVSDQCPSPPLTLSTTFQGFSHWLEAGALLMQRKK